MTGTFFGMFGRQRDEKPSAPFSDDLETTLREGGAPSAPATLLGARQGRVLAKGRGNVTIQYASWQLHIRVQPTDQAPFETHVTQVFTSSNMLRANVGQFTALYDPADHSRVRLDMAAWRRQFQNSAMHQQMAEAAEHFRQTGTVERAAGGAVSAAALPAVLQQMERLVASGAMTQEQFDIAKQRFGG
jgi:hypothetical protein